MRDLKLSYEAAMHGIQSAIRFEMSRRGIPDDVMDEMAHMLKHLRVGVDMRASDAGALAGLLIQKGVFTLEEYLEWIRLGANEELASYQDRIRKQYGVPAGAEFR